MCNESKLWRITLDTNPEDCNLNCVMCEEHSPYSHFKAELFAKTGIRSRRMPLPIVERLISEATALGVREILPSTMGEPLLYAHMDRIYELAKEYGLKINLTTNGTFPGRGVEAWAKLIVPTTSDVKVSWNGACAETYERVMRRGNFAMALSNLRKLITVRDQHYAATGYRCRITLQLTFMSHTMHELPDILRLAARCGVDRVKGHQLWAHFAEIKDYAIASKPEYIQEWNEIVEKAKKAQVRYRKPDGSMVILDNILPLQAKANQVLDCSYICPFLGKELWISASGKISPCCAPDTQRQALGDFGNIEERTLRDVLCSAEYQHLLQHYREYPLCKGCNMRRPVEASKVETSEI